ncbi:hypothetical protein MMC34_008121, partial [Xylographa carneopallida]|nr:hypothetical protein [Xylographa carneopallida]
MRPALIEVHNRPEIAMALSRRCPGIPLGLVLHNDPQAMRLARTPADRRALARRMRIAVVSEYLRRRYRDGSDALLVGLLPNCLDLAALPPASADGERERLILFAGRLVADKGADSFVAACAAALPELPGWRAEMIGADRPGGSPDTPFLAALRPAAARAGVTLAGYRPHGAVLEAMARAAIVVVPSRWPEPFGLTALEAMASGAALVTSGRGGLAELTAGAALRVDPDAPGALAEALRRLACDPSERRRLAASGRLRARDYDLPAARGDRRRGGLMRATAIRLLDRLGAVAVLLCPLFLLHGRGVAEALIDVVALAFLLRSAAAADWSWTRTAWVPVALSWWGWLVLCSVPHGAGGWPALLQAIATLRFLLFAAALQHRVLSQPGPLRLMRWLVAGACCYVAAQLLLQEVTGRNLFGHGRFGDGTLTGPYDKPRAAAPLSRLLLPTVLAASGWVGARAAVARNAATRWLLRAASLLPLLLGIATVVLAGQRMPLLLSLLGLLVSGLLLRRLRGAVL